MQLLNGDCLELMKTLPDKSIDLFICDLPYGCLNQGVRKDGKVNKTDEKQRFTPCSWDIKIDLVEFWKQVKRLMKTDHTPIIHFCNARFGFELYNSNPDWFRYDLVWNKNHGVGFLLANKQPLRSHENIYVFSKKGATYYRKDIEGDFPQSLVSKKVMERRTVQAGVLPKILRDNEGIRCILSILNFKNLTNRRNVFHHPTQKPLDLYKFLIERYSKEGDTVLDPTAGSFTSGLACRELNREYIGIEMDEVFYKKGVELLQE